MNMSTYQTLFASKEQVIYPLATILQGMLIDVRIRQSHSSISYQEFFLQNT